MRERIFGGLQEFLDRYRNRRIEELPVQSTGRNETFRHQPGCAKPQRPCGCMPTYRVKETDLVREFWVTPHLNRQGRRRLERLTREAS